METEGSLPCSQGHSTGPYPEPDQSNPTTDEECIQYLVGRYQLKG
jgi:hypothetical protein